MEALDIQPVDDDEEFVEPTVLIAHLSDLALDGAGGAEAGMARRALANKQIRQADLYVVTGNLTNNGSRLAHQAANSFLRPVMRKALVVPGTHDLAPHPAIGVDPATDWLRDYPAPGDKGAAWPRRVDLEDGQCVVFGLNSTRVEVERTAAEIGRVGHDQLTRLDAMLRELDPSQRRVVVLHHRVKSLGIGKRHGAEVEDAERLLKICEQHSVDLILHGAPGGFLRRRVGTIRVIGAPSLTSGCASTGQRFVPMISLGLATGTVTVERVQYARPANRPDLNEVFDTAEAMEAYTRLAERAYEAEDGFAAFAAEFEQRAGRLAALDAASAALDQQLAQMLSRGGDTAAANPILLAYKEGAALPDPGEGHE